MKQQNQETSAQIQKQMKVDAVTQVSRRLRVQTGKLERNFHTTEAAKLRSANHTEACKMSLPLVSCPDMSWVSQHMLWR